MILFQRYIVWVRSNPEQARRLENAFQMASLFLPTRGLPLGEDLSELLYTFSGIFNLTHNAIFESSSKLGHDTTENIKFALSVISSLSVLLEVLSKRIGGPKARIRLIWTIELAVAIARFYLLQHSANKMLLNGGKLTYQAYGPMYGNATESSDSESTHELRWWRGALTGITIPVVLSSSKVPITGGITVEGNTSQNFGIMSSPNESNLPPNKLTNIVQSSIDSILNVPLTPSVHAISESKRASSSASTVYMSSLIGGNYCDIESEPLLLLGEILHIIRPLISLSAEELFGRGFLSFFLSAITDLISDRCTSVSLSRSHGGSEAFFPISRGSDISSFVKKIVHFFFQSRTVPALVDSPLYSAMKAPPGTDMEMMLIKSIDSMGGGLVKKALTLVLSFLTNGNAASADVSAELRRRRILWLYYLLRTPVFERVTLPIANGTAKVGSYVPLVGSVLSFAVDTLRYLNSHHFSHSGSL